MIVLPTPEALATLQNLLAKCQTLLGVKAWRSILPFWSSPPANSKALSTIHVDL